MNFRFSLLTVFFLCWSSNSFSQELELGKNLGENSIIIADVTERIPIALYQFLQQLRVQEELEVTSHQKTEIETANSQRLSFIDMQKIGGLDGSLKALGNLSEVDAKSLRDELIGVADEDRNKFVSRLGEILDKNQMERLGQLFVQTEVIFKNNRYLPRFGLPPPRKITDAQRRALQQGLRRADQQIAEMELAKLRYRYYSRVFDNVFGEGSGMQFFGQPFGFDVDENAPPSSGNPRRRRQ